MNHTRRWLVPFAFVAMGALMIALSGCRRGEEPAADQPESPDSHVKDPVFRRELAAARKEREGYHASRAKLVRELERRIEAQKAAMPGASDEAVKAALERDPEWVELANRVRDLTTAIGENGRRAQGIVRERLAPRRKISK